MTDLSPFKANSLVVNPPAGIHLELRFKLEATAFAMRTAFRAISSVESVIQKCCTDHARVELSADELIGLSADCWTAVDQTHMLTAVLKTLPHKNGDPIDTFASRYNAAREIRNVTRHLHQRLPQLIAKKDAAPTIFGVLTFLNYLGTKRDDRGQEIHNGWYFTIPFGSLHPQATIKMPQGDMPPNLGLCFLEFRAHGHVVKLLELKEDLLSLFTVLEESMQSSVQTAAKAHGVAPETLARPLQGAVVALHASWDKK